MFRSSILPFLALLFAGIISSPLAQAQVQISPDFKGNQGFNIKDTPPAQLSSLKDPVETFMQTITERDLQAHLQFLASDELEGRETGERGQKLAAKYLATQFQKMGLKPGVTVDGESTYYQTYELEKAEVKDAWFSLTGKDRYELFTDWVGFSPVDLALPFSGDFVFAGYGIKDDSYNNYKNLNVKGKIVVVLSGEPMGEEGEFLMTNSTKPSAWSDNFGLKSKTAKEAGAKGVIQICLKSEFDAIAGNRWVKHRMTHASLNFPDKDAQAFPILFVSPEVGSVLLKPSKKDQTAWRKGFAETDQVADISFKKLSLDYHSTGIKEIITAENVLGVLEGSDKKDEVVILTAHMDHLGVKEGQVFYGADDDGSGTVAVLEIAEAFTEAARQGFKPRRTILFMPVSGEEKGLLGSEYYSEHPVFPLEQTVCDLNIDMIGRIDQAHVDKRQNEYVYIIGDDRLSNDLHDASEAAKKRYSNVELDYTFNTDDDPNKFYYRSDHYNFAKHNIPVIFYFTGVHEDYHKATDTEDKIMYNKMMKITRLVFATAWDAANRDVRYRLNEK